MQRYCCLTWKDINLQIAIHYKGNNYHKPWAWLSPKRKFKTVTSLEIYITELHVVCQPPLGKRIKQQMSKLDVKRKQKGQHRTEAKSEIHFHVPWKPVAIYVPTLRPSHSVRPTVGLTFQPQKDVFQCTVVNFILLK